MLQLHVQSGGETPIYRQIEDQITAAIRGRRLRAGEVLPPSGELAASLVTSPRTVLRAYHELERAGWVSGGDGWRVAPLPSHSRAGGASVRRLDGPDRELLLCDLEAAGEIQRRLLPPAELVGDGFAAAARTAPAGYVSGDFFDLHITPGGALGAVVADVAGTGLGAGLVMASVKATLRFLVGELPVEETLRRLNQGLAAELGRRRFVALAYARFDPRRRRLELANAGLPDPYLLAPGREPRPVAVPGPRLPLGLRPELEYRSRSLPLHPGERLLMFTDGLPEARSQGEPLGYEALTGLLASSAAAPAAAQSPPGPWLDAFFSRVQEATRPDPDDDWTALLIDSRAGRREEGSR